MPDLFTFILSHGDQFRRARLPSLYSDFDLQRNSNPDGFAANIAAWTEALSKAAQAGLLPAPGNDRDTLSLQTGETLLRSLETKEWGRPLALGTVIDEAVSQRQMIPYQEFLAARKILYNRTWTVRPWWLLSWGFKYLGLMDWTGRSETLPSGRFVLVPNIEEAASKILSQMAHQANQIDRIYPISMFSARAAKIISTNEHLTESDLQIILTYLARDKSAITYDSQAVKFQSPRDTSSNLSTQDKTIASLKSFIADLNSQVALLSSKVSNLSESAQAAVRNKNRVSAWAALRSKKLNETVLAQRTETLAQMEEVYTKIEEAADQVALVRIMEASAGVLRGLHVQIAGVEKVGGVLDKLRDQMSKVDEVSSVIEAAGQGNYDIDEDAVDKELESLERQAKSEREEKQARETQEKLSNISANGDSRGSKQATVPHRPSSPSQSSNKAHDSFLEDGIYAIGHLSLDKERHPMEDVETKSMYPEEPAANAVSGG